jgi:hypothetical protein
MSLKVRVWSVVVTGVLAVTVLHLWLNLHVFDAHGPEVDGGRRFRVGFLPVT